MTPWVVTGASVAGAGKARNADRFAMMEKEGVLMLAVADGAGSARFGHQGARRAVTGALMRMAQTAESEDAAASLEEWAASALSEIASRRRRGAAISDYATTLLAVRLQGSELHALQIGDGAIVVRDASGAWRTLFEPQRGAYANETWFVTSERPDLVQTCIVAAPAALALFTDGLEPLILDHRQQCVAGGVLDHIDSALHARAAGNQVRSRALARFLRSETVTRRSGGDDCTLVLARRTA